ncbi:MAG: hydrogenase maturation protease [Dethiobacteria bacterium]|jgi:hydrogenase maturation protease
MKKIKIIGCGNLLAHDEGVGIHIVRRLQNEILPESVEIRELRSPGQLLVELLAGSDKVIIIDACSTQGPAGTVYRYTLKEGDSDNLEGILFKTIHAHNFYPLLELRGKISPSGLPKEIIVIGIEIEERHRFCIGLSQNVFAVVDEVVNMIMNELY